MAARLPQGMSGLAIVLLLSHRNGYGKAGIAVGVSVAGSAISNIVLARLVDRVGARLALIPAASAYAAGMVALAILDHRGYAVALTLCAAIGLVTPPVSSVSRGLWPRLLGAEQAQVIYGLEATAQELIFIVGPTTVGLVAGLSSPRAAVIVTAACGLLGAIAYLSSPPFRESVNETRPTRQPVLFGTGVLWYAVVGVCLTLGFNMTEIATVDFVSGRTASAAAGIVLAVWSAGSLAGGIRFGAASAAVTDRRLARVVGLAAVGLAIAALAPDDVGLAVLLFIGAAAVAPALARLYTRLGSIAPDGATTETFGWLAVGFQVGSSAGSSVGGISVDAAGPRLTFLFAGAAALLSVLAIVGGSRRARQRAVAR